VLEEKEDAGNWEEEKYADGNGCHNSVKIG
jgi:hypothetical protein